MKRKSINQGFSICLALIFFVLASGCVGPTVRTYKADKLPKPEVAVIKGYYVFALFGYMTIDIWEVDTVGRTKPLKATKVEVLPGWHELTIRILSETWSGGRYLRYQRVAFNAEAGHEYKIRSPWEGFGIRKGRIDIIDVNTGAIILSQPFFPRKK